VRGLQLFLPPCTDTCAPHPGPSRAAALHLRTWHSPATTSRTSSAATLAGDHDTHDVPPHEHEHEHDDSDNDMDTEGEGDRDARWHAPPQQLPHAPAPEGPPAHWEHGNERRAYRSPACVLPLPVPASHAPELLHRGALRAPAAARARGRPAQPVRVRGARARPAPASPGRAHARGRRARARGLPPGPAAPPLVALLLQELRGREVLVRAPARVGWRAPKVRVSLLPRARLTLRRIIAAYQRAVDGGLRVAADPVRGMTGVLLSHPTRMRPTRTAVAAHNTMPGDDAEATGAGVDSSAADRDGGVHGEDDGPSARA
jgi:hypothetical protein